MTDNLPATQERRPPAVTAGGNVGALIPQDIEQAFRIAQALAGSGMTPQGFQRPEQCFVAIMAGAELGLPPFQSLQSFAIINNRPTLWGDALVAVVRTNGFTLREWYEGEGDTLTAFCEVTRPDNGDVAVGEFSVDDAKTAKLWGKGGPWTSNPKRMLKMRARAFAIRDGAADVLRGFQIREEVEDYGEALPVEQKREGTGLLGKLQASNTLATEGFGIRDIENEAAAATPESKKRAPRKAKAADLGAEVMDAIAEAEPEIVAQVVEDHADQTRYFYHPESDSLMTTTDGSHAPSDGLVEELTWNQYEAIRQRQEAAGPPADAQVKEPAVVAPEPAETVADGHAEPGEAYFLGDKEAFPSGRRVAYVDGVEQKDPVEDGTLPVYAEHAPKVEAQTTDSETAETGLAEGENAASTELDLGFDPAPEDPFATFNAAAVTAKTWAELRPALVALGKTDAYRARPHDAMKARLEVAGLMETWNEAGAKLDPVDDPWLFQCFVTGSDDVEAINGTLALAQDADWFKGANEAQQSGIKRFAFARVQQIGGA